MHVLVFLALAQTPAPLDAGLQALPRDGAFLLTVQLAKLFSTPSGQALLKINPMVGMMLGEGLGLDPAQIERISLYQHVALAEPVVIVAMKDPINVDRAPGSLREMWQAWVKQGDLLEVKRHGGRYFRDETTWRSVLFLTDRVVVLGDSGSVEAYHDRLRADESRTSLSQAITAARDACVVLHLDLDPFHIPRTGWPAWPSKKEDHLAPLAQIQRLLLTLAIDEHVNFRFLVWLPEKTTEIAQTALNKLKVHVADVLNEGREELLDRVSDHTNVETRELRKGMAHFLSTTEKSLRKAQVDLHREASSLEVSGRLEGPDALANGAMFLLGTALRTQIYDGVPVNPDTKRLERIARALEAYRKDHGTLPPLYTTDFWGRPLLSWRVLLLPYLGQAEARLFAKFRLDEPWDSEHNLPLLRQMPDAYALGDTDRPTTTLQAVVGKDVVFTGGAIVLGQRLGTAKDRPLLGRAAKAVPWSKPKDAPLGADTRPAVGFLPDGTLGPSAVPTQPALPGLPGLAP